MPRHFPAVVWMFAAIGCLCGPLWQSTSRMVRGQTPPRDLPYERPSDTGSGADGPLNDARALFRLYGISDQDFASFDQRPPMTEIEERVVARLLFRSGRLTPSDLVNLRRPASNWWGDRANLLGQIVHIEGTATHMDRCVVPADLQEALEFREYYRVGVKLAESLGGRSVEILTQIVPRQWLDGEWGTLDEPVAADAMLVESYDAQSEPSQATFVAGRMAWYPRTDAGSTRIPRGWTYLAAEGVDIGLFDGARRSNGRDLSGEDRELFYQMLAACGRRSVNEIGTSGDRLFALADLLVRPESHQGELVSFVANARRITKVVVDDVDIQTRFQLDHYFEIDITIPLEQPIRLKGATPAESPTYENIYPATLCVVRLPPQLEQLASGHSASISRSAVLNEPIQVRAYFFKIWAYRSEFISAVAPRQRHPSPLFLGTTVEPQPVATMRGESTFGIALAVSLGAAVLILGIVIWRVQRRDGQLARARRLASPAKIDLPVARHSESSESSSGTP